MERPHNKKVTTSPVVMRSHYSQEIKNLQKETQQMEEQLKMLKIVSGSGSGSPVSLPSKSDNAKIVVPSKPKQTYVTPKPTTPTHWSNSKSIKYQQPTTPTVTKPKQTFERGDSVGVGRSVEVKKSDLVLSGSFNEDESHQSFLEALNEWRRGSGMTVESEKEKEKSTTKASVGVSESSGGDLLKGSFDESESHESFLEALNAWRGNAQPDTTSTTNTKTSTTVETTTTTSTGSDSDSVNNENKKVDLQLKPEGTSEWGKAISEGTVSIPLNSYFLKLQRAGENQKNDG